MFPILFHLGLPGHTIPIHTYGIVLTIAIIIGVYRAVTVTRWRAEQPGALRADDVLDAGIWMVISGIIGARVLFVLLEWHSYSSHPESMLRVWEGGISFHGALFGGLLGLILFCQRKKISILQMADLYAPSVMVSYAIGRLGCFFNGCCYGRPTHLPWGVRFYDDGHWTVPSHPTQLYASALSLVFFGVLVWLEKRQTFRGQLFCAYMMLAAVERFVMEIWRAGATSDVLALGMTDTQWFCIGMFVLALIGSILYRQRNSFHAPNQLAGVTGP